MTAACAACALHFRAMSRKKESLLAAEEGVFQTPGDNAGLHVLEILFQQAVSCNVVQPPLCLSPPLLPSLLCDYAVGGAAMHCQATQKTSPRFPQERAAASW